MHARDHRSNASRLVREASMEIGTFPNRHLKKWPVLELLSECSTQNAWREANQDQQGARAVDGDDARQVLSRLTGENR